MSFESIVTNSSKAPVANVTAPAAGIPAGCPTTLVTVSLLSSLKYIYNLTYSQVTREAAATTAAPVATVAPVATAAPVVTAPAAGGDASPFGTCDPTMKFVGGLGGRPQTEFTFQSNDATISAVQQEALNPNIITNRICDQLTNTCKASAAGKATCLAAKATILASGKRDATVVAAWKAALGL